MSNAQNLNNKPTTLSILERVTRHQLEAANPENSAWVSANAGAGKTHVLTLRVIHLMLQGVPPNRILCLTYTKAAAAEMSNRVFKRLSEWATLSDQALREALQKELRITPDYKMLKTARRLFADALETPGGLKIQTIHAFCERVLHQFPFEADIPSQFDIITASQEAELFNDVLDDIFVDYAHHHKGDDFLLRRLLNHTSDQTLFSNIKEALGNRSAIQKWLADEGGVEKAIAAMKEQLGLDPSYNQEQLLADMAELALIKSEDFREAFISACKTSSAAKERNIIIALEQIRGKADVQEIFTLIAPIYLTNKAGIRKDILTNAMVKNFPALADMLIQDAEKIKAIFDNKNKLVFLSSNHDFFTLMQDIFERYKARKISQSFLDFNDLIEKTVALLNKDQDAASWVHYKLDKGIDHILVDEAQDTSPQQWSIISALTNEFFAGLGEEREMNRTMFAVGDEKQSIYSFQGAEPEKFKAEQKKFHKKIEKAQLSFKNVPLAASFRSVPDILDAVDLVFNTSDAKVGVRAEEEGYHISALPELPDYVSLKRQVKGHVEIWPLVSAEQVDMDPLSPAYHKAVVGSASHALAQKIAKQIHQWLKFNHQKPTGGVIEPGDILILVSKRSAFVSQLVRALKRYQIPVAGADRLKVQAHIVAQDLNALAQVMLLPEDDLSLAAVLKSPLFGLNDDDLIFLAAERKGRLWDSLYHNQSKDHRYKNSFEKLTKWQARIDFHKPFDFFSTILGAEGGRMAFVAAMGAEANDVIDAYLDKALNFEHEAVPTMQHFLKMMMGEQGDLKRDMDSGQNEVRIMTVHGAKGLEAPIVFMADTSKKPSANKLSKILKSGEASQENWLWSINAGLENDAVKAAKEQAKLKQIEEYNRLLYVGMTRASEALYICGLMPKKLTELKGSWYNSLSLALGRYDAPTDEAVLKANETTFIWRGDENSFPIGDSQQVKAEKEYYFEDLPDHILASPPSISKRLALIRPSQEWAELEDESNDQAAIEGFDIFTPKEEGAKADIASQNIDPRKRGMIMHNLLQLLPSQREADLLELAKTMIRYHVPAFDSDNEIEKLALFFVQQIEAMKRDEQIAPLLMQEGKSELPIQGVLQGKGQKNFFVSGQIDRVVISEDEVHIIDYKTDRLMSKEAKDIKVDYIKQLALYQALMQQIYPTKKAKASILWTSKPALMTIDDLILTENLEAFLKSR